MKKFLTTVLVISATVSILNAGDKYSDLTSEYLNKQASTKIKRIIANDPQTDRKVLEMLFQDKDQRVRGNVVANPSF